MKIEEGKWVAKNLDGVERRFSNVQDAEEWRKSRSPEKRMSFKQYLDKLDVEKEKEKPSLSEIWRKFQEAVSSSFPDGDFIDYLSPWMDEHNVSIADVDAAVKKYDGAHSAYDYMQKMWDDHAADAEHDAMQGHLGQTYGDEWFTRPNPWK